jgi:hypothetical protein
VVNQAETVKAEREACAQIADDVAAIHDALGQGTSAATALRIRDAIRARRNRRSSPMTDDTLYPDMHDPLD